MQKLIPEKITAYYKIECVYGVMAFTVFLIVACKSGNSAYPSLCCIAYACCT